MIMRRLIKTTIVTLAAALVLAGGVAAELVTIDEARRIANNWVQYNVYRAGDWQERTDATVRHVSELRQDEHLLAYYCEVEPSGFVLVGLVKGLRPVIAYSDDSRLDLDETDGPTELCRFKIAEELNEVELQAGPVASTSRTDMGSLTVFDYQPLWDMLLLPEDMFMTELKKTAGRGNYEYGEILLTSRWRQGDPYNRQCPAGHNGCTAEHCAVGCVATAAAQIMRYWSWPPGRSWTQMTDSIYGASTDWQINSVAELCAAIGAGVNMSYCDSNCISTAYLQEVEGFLEIRSYGDCAMAYRSDFASGEEWFDGAGMIKDQVSANRPIQYGILLHSMVLDGWRGSFHGADPPEVHINYGWNSGWTMWYVVDNLHQVVDTATFMHEDMLIGIVPRYSFEGYASGVYPATPGFPPRYVDRDCEATDAVFEAGNRLQFLPEIRFRCAGGTARVDGSPTQNSVLFTGETDHGVRIYNGSWVFHEGGYIRMHLERPAVDTTSP